MRARVNYCSSSFDLSFGYAINIIVRLNSWCLRDCITKFTIDDFIGMQLCL